MMKFVVAVLLVVVAVYAQDPTTMAPHHTKHPHTQHPHTQHAHTQHAHTQHPHTQHPHTQHPHTTHAPNQHHANVRHTFIGVDTNKDGMITFDEVQAAYKAADTDGDGHISLAEYQAAHPELSADLAQAMYKYMDVNENKSLDMNDLKSVFHQYDVDGDDKISLHEFTVEYSAVHNLLSHQKPIIG